ALESEDLEQHPKVMYQQSDSRVQQENQQSELIQEVKESRWMTVLVNYLQHGTYLE
ncbi:hypothetical protein KI387_009331, partial [Taxus chinensis]